MNFWSCQARSEHARFCLNDEGQFEGREEDDDDEDDYLAAERESDPRRV